MHLASEAITLECAVLGVAAAAGGVGYSMWRLASSPQWRPESRANTTLKAAALVSLVFAAQMLNVPVLASSSVHFVGGVLLAELLGPALGVLTMSAVLLLQAIILGDGGMAALGVNITNMALLPAGSLLLVRRWIVNRPLAVAAASALSIALAVLWISGEVAFGRPAGELAHWSDFVGAMLTNHLPLLALEGALTVALVELWRRGEKVGERSTWRLPATAVTGALLVAALSLAASSTLPDGYESAAESAQMTWLIDSQ
jgi:cobalt/nickel transport system permease protein